jgi:hypothetical protein
LPLTTALLLLDGVVPPGTDEEQAAEHAAATWLLGEWDSYQRSVVGGTATPESRRAALRLPAALLLLLGRLRPDERAGALADGWVFGLAVGAAHGHLRIAPDITGEALVRVAEAVRQPRPPDVPGLCWGTVCKLCGCPRNDPSGPCEYCSPDRATPILWASQWREFDAHDWFQDAAAELDGTEGVPLAEVVEGPEP